MLVKYESELVDSTQIVTSSSRHVQLKNSNLVDHFISIISRSASCSASSFTAVIYSAVVHITWRFTHQTQYWPLFFTPAGTIGAISSSRTALTLPDVPRVNPHRNAHHYQTPPVHTVSQRSVSYRPPPVRAILKPQRSAPLPKWLKAPSIWNSVRVYSWEESNFSYTRVFLRDDHVQSEQHVANFLLAGHVYNCVLCDMNNISNAHDFSKHFKSKKHRKMSHLFSTWQNHNSEPPRHMNIP